MLAGPHLAVGALTGRVVRRAWLALPLAFASHYALDALPHAYFSLREGGQLPLKLALVTIDGVIGVALVLWIARGQPHRRVILGAALAATLVDLMNPVTSVGRWLAETPGPAWLMSMHMQGAWHVPFGRQWLLGFGPAAAVLVLTALAAWALNARGRPAQNLDAEPRV
jgi:hypothetical protein